MRVNKRRRWRPTQCCTATSTPHVLTRASWHSATWGLLLHTCTPPEADRGGPEQDRLATTTPVQVAAPQSAGLTEGLRSDSQRHRHHISLSPILRYLLFGWLLSSIKHQDSHMQKACDGISGSFNVSATPVTGFAERFYR